MNYLAGSLTARGYEVSTVCSDWRITAEHREILLQMVEESAAVARETQSAASTLFTEWSEERNAQIRAGLLTLNVGHLDLLAVPAEGSSASSGQDCVHVSRIGFVLKRGNMVIHLFRSQPVLESQSMALA